MRATFLALLLVNLMYLAWAEWIDVRVPAPNAIADLPRLRLASAPSEGDPAAQPAAAAPPPAAGASGSQGVSAAQCISVGPFNSLADASRASTLLMSQGLPARERVAQGLPVQWYWVSIPAPASAADIKGLLAQLKGDGIDGAEPMTMGGEQRISLGMFQDQQLAVRQQQLASQKGFQPQLTAEQLVPPPVYWLDLWVTGGTDTPPLEALKAEAGTPIGIQACPPNPAPGAPPAGAQAVSPGIPAPQGATATSVPPGPAATNRP